MVCVICKLKAKRLSFVNYDNKLLYSPFLGLWLCGLLVSGELFLWNRDKDLLKTAAATPEVVKIITTVQGVCSMKTSVSC